MTEPILDGGAPAAVAEPAAPGPAPTAPIEGPGQAVEGALKAEADATANKEFLGALPEALRDMPSLKNVKGVDDLATQFVNQSAMLGNSLRIPTKDTSPEQSESFYSKLTEVPGVIRLPGEGADEAVQREFLTKLGVPATANEYKYQLPEGVTLEDSYLQNATETAFSLGLTNQQLGKVFERELSDREAAKIAQGQYIDQSTLQLKSIWGTDYDARIAGANNALRIYAQEMPEYADELKSFANNPLLVKLLSDMAENLSESGHAGMSQAANYGMSVNDARMKKEEIMNNDAHDYHKGTEEAVKFMSKLQEIIASGKQ